MDPQLYKLLEVSWEAWVDSGIDVRGLRDSNRVGVYTGICGSEVNEICLINFELWRQEVSQLICHITSEGFVQGCQLLSNECLLLLLAALIDN